MAALQRSVVSSNGLLHRRKASAGWELSGHRQLPLMPHNKRSARQAADRPGQQALQGLALIRATARPPALQEEFDQPCDAQGASQPQHGQRRRRLHKGDVGSARAAAAVREALAARCRLMVQREAAGQQQVGGDDGLCNQQGSNAEWLQDAPCGAGGQAEAAAVC